MPRTISDELREKIRKDVSEGKSRYEVAREVGVGVGTVYEHTYDLPKRGPRLTAEMKIKLRKAIEGGMSKTAAAKACGVSPESVYYWARGSPIEYDDCGIRGNSLKMLQSLSKEGYFIPTKKMTQHPADYRKLTKYIPVRRVQAKKRVIYFMDGREKDAFLAYTDRLSNRMMTDRRLTSLMSLFNLSKNDRDSIGIGKHSGVIKLIERINAKKRGLKNAVSDLVGSFLHSELLK